VRQGRERGKGREGKGKKGGGEERGEREDPLDLLPSEKFPSYATARLFGTVHHYCTMQKHLDATETGAQVYVASFWRCLRYKRSERQMMECDHWIYKWTQSKQSRKRTLKVRIPLHGKPSQSYGASLAIRNHTVFTCHPTQVNAPRLNLSQAGTRFTYHRGMEG